jgi:hypothetical protein
MLLLKNAAVANVPNTMMFFAVLIAMVRTAGNAKNSVIAIIDFTLLVYLYQGKVGMVWDIRLSYCVGIGLRGNYFEIFGAKRQDNHNMVSKNGLRCWILPLMHPPLYFGAETVQF